MGRKLREKAIFAAKKYCVAHKQDLLFSSLNNDTITYYLDNIDNQLTINNFTQSYPQYEELFEKAGCYNVLDSFVKDIISEYIHKHINTMSKYTEFHTLNNAIINALLELLPTFIQNITFPTYENGYYKHTWLDSDTYNRWDANPVFDYLIDNDQIMNQILQKANVTINDLNQYMSWNTYIQKLKNNPYILENFHLEVRKYLVARNPNIAIQKSEKINAINDKQQIVKMNNQGEFIDQDGNIVNENTLPYIEIDFDPRSDDQRERPIVIIREFKKNNKYKDHVIIGEQGANHGL